MIVIHACCTMKGISCMITQIAKFMGPTWGPPGSCRPQMGPMLVPWTLLSGNIPVLVHWEWSAIRALNKKCSLAPTWNLTVDIRWLFLMMFWIWCCYVVCNVVLIMPTINQAPIVLTHSPWLHVCTPSLWHCFSWHLILFTILNYIKPRQLPVNSQPTHSHWCEWYASHRQWNGQSMSLHVVSIIVNAFRYAIESNAQFLYFFSK